MPAYLIGFEVADGLKHCAVRQGCELMILASSPTIGAEVPASSKQGCRLLLDLDTRARLLGCRSRFNFPSTGWDWMESGPVASLAASRDPSRRQYLSKLTNRYSVGCRFFLNTGALAASFFIKSAHPRAGNSLASAGGCRWHASTERPFLGLSSTGEHPVQLKGRPDYPRPSSQNFNDRYGGEIMAKACPNSRNNMPLEVQNDD